MKKYRIIYIIISLMLIFIFLLISRNKYSKIHTTDLDKENINGISLMEKYNENSIEEILGKVYKKIEDKNFYTYEYATQKFIVDLKVDKDNNIIEIGTGLMDNSLKTKKGITKDSTFADIEKAYGKNFLKKKYTDLMRSGDGYFITYVDKKNKSEITFEFSAHNDGKLSNVRLFKY